MLYIKVLILSTCSDPVEEAHGSRSGKKKKGEKYQKSHSCINQSYIRAAEACEMSGAEGCN